MSGSAMRGRAQALIEFALILPISLIVILGGVDLGRGLVYGVSVQDGAREAARLASTAAVDSNVNDSAVYTRLIAGSNPSLAGCAATNTANQSCGGGTWTFSVNVVTPANTTYTSITSAQADANFPGSTVTVTAVGSVSMLAGFQTAWGWGLNPITVKGQSVMVVW